MHGNKANELVLILSVLSYMCMVLGAKQMDYLILNRWWGENLVMQG